jgi:predicted nucleic acid-binding protein
MFPAPVDLWTIAARPGQTCRRRGIAAGSMDRLIATTAILHQVKLITLDDDFGRIANVSDLCVEFLRPPA